MSSPNKWYFRKGELKSAVWEVHVDANNPPAKPWASTGIRVGKLSSGVFLELPADNNERLIFPLEGEKISVQYLLSNSDEIHTQVLRGRKSVFHGPSDLLYLPINTLASVSGLGRVLVSESPAKNSKPVKYMPKEDVPVELRGAGRETRQVHNFGLPDVLDADRMIAVEVIVPAGNWSGSPAHKHDTYVPGKESNLEEIYYFESAVSRGLETPVSSNPFGIFRGISADNRPYDVNEEIHSGDVVLVPYGWHGPAAAGPGYDLYFFNVMAGPDPDREWNLTDHPDQAWIRKSWETQKTDSRLPYKA